MKRFFSYAAFATLALRCARASSAFNHTLTTEAHTCPPPQPCQLAEVLSTDLLATYHKTDSFDVHYYFTGKDMESVAIKLYNVSPISSPGRILSRQIPGTVPILHSHPTSGHHHSYTTSLAEFQNLRTTYSYYGLGVIGYVFKEEQCGAVPLYRVSRLKTTMVNSNLPARDTVLTTSIEQRNSILSDSAWTNEGIAGYALPSRQ